MTDPIQQRRLDHAARRAALLFERQRDSAERVAAEESRHNAMVAKTARLREQRLARDKAVAETAKKKRK